MDMKLLIIGNDADLFALFRKEFPAEETDLGLIGDIADAMKFIAQHRPNVAVIDLDVQEGTGLEALRFAKEVDPSLSVIIVTGSKDTRQVIEAMKMGAYDYQTRPFNIQKLRSVVLKAAECNLLTRKTVRFAGGRESFGAGDGHSDVMIGSSPEMLEVWKMVGRVAGSSAAALIQGESGTGKELLARAIYNYSERHPKPFLAVNCAALPENLLESELFGHEKGAFTDAYTRRIGKFEQCNGGTIFLDEIAEMSLANQGKLLRVLENQEFERVGGNETIKVDVRVIAATNKSLVQAVKDKSFRLDLFYRLRVISFFLPPLRERIEDIPLLVELFIGKFSHLHGKSIRGIAPKALERLIDLPWEGNIRELKNIINSAVVLCQGDILLPEDFAKLMPERDGGRRVEHSGATGDIAAYFRQILEPDFDVICRKMAGKVYDALQGELERVVISMALERSGNNQVHAAKLLGISRNTLRSRLAREMA